MAKAKTNETLKGKTPDELNAHVAELKKELFNLRFQKAAGELKSTARFKQARQEIARILTQLRASKKAA